MERKIRMVLLDNLTPEDLLKLKHGGFFDGVQVPMPAGVTGKEATLKVKDEPGVERVREVPVVLGDKLDPAELANTSESMKPVKTKKPKVEEPKPEPVPTSSEVIQQTKDVEQAEKARDEAREMERKANAEFAAGEPDTGGIDPEKLASFTKLRDIIQYVIDSGIAPAGVATFCEGVKADVPLLSRIPNIAERVARTLEVMGA